MNREKTRKWGAPAMLFLAVVLITALIGCASFEGEIPIEEQWPEVVYISPLNQDGIQDEVRLSFTLPELDNLHVTGYKIAITSESGREIYSEGVDRTEDTQSKRIERKKRPFHYRNRLFGTVKTLPGDGFQTECIPLSFPPGMTIITAAKRLR